MAVIVLLAVLAALVNGVSYLRSPDFRLRRWTHKWGIQHYAAFAHAEAAGLRIRPVDRLEMTKLRRLSAIRSVVQPVLLGTVAMVLLNRGTSLWISSLVLGLLLLPQLSPHLMAGQVIGGIRSGKQAAAVRGAVYSLFGCSLLFGGVAAILWAAQLADAGAGVGRWMVHLLSGLALLAACALATSTAKRTLATTLPARFGSATAFDDTLFLRSFNDDAMRFRAVNPHVGAFGVFQGLTVRFEELMAALVSKESSLVAIGKPGEPLPELGAVRTYVSDDEWQSAVEETAKRAGSILLVAGVTDGLEWELTHLREWGLTQKVTVLLPPVDESQAWNRLHRVLRQLGIDFDEIIPENETGSWLGVLLRTVSAIGVDVDGQPCFYVSDRRDWISFGATILMSQQIVRGRALPPEHGSIAEFIGLDVRDSVLTPVASQTEDPLELENLTEDARVAVRHAVELAADGGVEAEHLLVALLRGDHDATSALEAIGVDLLEVRTAAGRLLERQSG